MIIKHSLKNEKTQKEIQDPSFLITNKNQGFSWINPQETKSRYQGIFLKENNKIFRIIESLITNKPEKITNQFYKIKTQSKKSKQEYIMPTNLNSFIFKSNTPTQIILDFKEIYQDNYAEYKLNQNNNELEITINYNQETYYLIIKHNGTCTNNNEWIQKEYEYDKNRNSPPFNRSVFSIGKINAQKIIFSLSSNKQKAKKESQEIFQNTEKFEKQNKKRINSLIKSKDQEQEINLAYNSCRIQLDNLTNKQGLFAGLPWFFQYWSRDELISLKGLNEINKEKSKQIINKWIKHLKNFNFPAKEKIDQTQEGTSIDATGWLLKRLELFPEILQKNKKTLDEFFSSLDDKLITEKTNTWMDSIKRNSGIELQTMKLYALKLASKLTNKKKDSKEKENNLKQKIKQTYYQNKYLFDSTNKKIRPNIFIAYYFYPELLNKQEWEKVFDKTLQETWCEWGGLSTISKNDKEFHENYTGETPGSYHNGDSWFWINNLSAICMQKLNKQKYNSYIKKIINASTNEILFIQAIANHAELSSASSLKSYGAPSQAWSAAMFIELIEEINMNV